MSIPAVFADGGRGARCGTPEIVLAQGKENNALLEAIRALLNEHPVMVTRCSDTQLDLLAGEFPGGAINRVGRTFTVGGKWDENAGRCMVITAGSSDIPVAEEAASTLEYLGIEPIRAYDRGVAGLHRLNDVIELLAAEPDTGVIVIAGMEGALPSVVASSISQPVVAVPTSVGYGSSFEGLSALLGMLNSCVPGITVVNIDNGFGAAVAVYRWMRMLR